MVRVVRRAVGSRQVGHTGTLDPFATGLLVVLVGRATRLARFVEGQAKTYRATVRLGVRTDTDDATGEPVGGSGGAGGWPDEATVAAAVQRMIGPQAQVPPAFSAKHVDGVRSHRLARAGAAVALPPVAVEVFEAAVLGYAPPDLDLRVRVSAGTYVRALGRDLGEGLGTGAHLTTLRREAIGPLQVADALPLEAVVPGVVLQRPAAVLTQLPRATLDAAGVHDVAHGRAVAGGRAGDGPTLLLDGEGEVVAIAEPRAGGLHPIVVLAQP